MSNHLIKITSTELYEKFNFIVKHKISYYNIKIKTELILPNIISILILKSISNKLSYSEKNNNDYYYNRYSIVNDVSEDFVKFLIFFYDDNLNLNLTKFKTKNKEQNLTEIVNKLIFKCLSVLEKEKFLIKKTKPVYNNNKKNETQVFYTTNLNIQYSDLNVNLNIFFNPLETQDFNKNKYYKGYHFLSTIKIFRENWKSNKFFDLNSNSNILKKLIKMKYYLNKDLYLTTKKLIFKDLNLDISLNTAETLNILLENYNSNRKFYYFKQNQKKNSELYNIIVFLYLEKYPFIFEKYFYLPHYFDFRGRLYSDSIISPIGNKIFRFLYTYGNYTEEELNRFEKNSLKVNFDLVENILKNTNLKTLYPDIENNSTLKYIVYICFFELGKINKNNFINIKKGKLTLQDFIDIGIDLYNSYNKNLKLFDEYKNNIETNNFFDSNWVNNSDSDNDEFLDDDENLNQFNNDFKQKLEIEYILSIIRLWNNKKFVKFIIWKDATASAIQIQMVLFKSQNKSNLERCNLTNSVYWWDTYYHIIDYFLNSYDKNKLLNFDKTYFNRIFLKKTIMTYMYSAKKLTCYKDFYKTASLHNKYNKLQNEFDEFYNFLEYFFKDNLFFNETKIKNFNDVKDQNIEQKMFDQVTYDNSYFSILYYKLAKKREEKNFKKQRFTIQFRYLLKEIDDRKIRNAYNPNIIHSIDACIVRLVISNLLDCIITVHDSFGIDILNIENLIIAVNQAYEDLNSYYNEKNSESVNSFFILL